MYAVFEDIHMRRMIRLLACGAAIFLVSTASVRPSQPLQRVSIYPKSCDGAPVGPIDMQFYSLPDDFLVKEVRATTADSTGAVSAMLPAGLFQVSMLSRNCNRTFVVAVLSGFDRRKVIKLRSNNVAELVDGAPALAGQLPPGISSAALYSADASWRAIRVELDKGAYYVDALGRGLYVLRLTGRDGRIAKVPIDLTDALDDAIVRRDVSRTEYSSAVNVKGSPFYRPGKIVVNRNGAWILDAPGNRVYRIESGNVQTFELPALESVPTDIATYADSTWIAESDAGRIARISSTGAISEFEIPPNGRGNPIRPEYFAHGGGGRLWFSEDYSSTIDAIDGAGRIETYPLPPAGGWASTLTSGPDGRMWIAGDRALSAMDPRGHWTSYSLGVLGVRTVTSGKDVLWLSLDSGDIMRVAADGTHKTFALPLQGTGGVRMAEAGDGVLWFADIRPGETIGSIDLEGKVRQSYVDFHPAGISDIAVDPKGVVWFAEPLQSAIQSATGRFFVLPRGISPQRISFDSDGNLWFSAAKAGIVGVIRPDGHASCFDVRLRAATRCRGSAIDRIS